MPYNPKIHNRQSIRLKGYDYSKPGAYFLTICAQNNQHLFGEVVGNEMILNDAGKMVENWYFELENKYPNSKSREYMVMPNHFHCIIEIVDGENDVSRDAHDVQRDVPITWCVDVPITWRVDVPITWNNPNMDPITKNTMHQFLI